MATLPVSLSPKLVASGVPGYTVGTDASGSTSRKAWVSPMAR